MFYIKYVYVWLVDFTYILWLTFVIYYMFDECFDFCRRILYSWKILRSVAPAR